MREAMIALLVAVLAFVAAPAAAARHVRYALSLDAIELRPGVTADLHTTVFVNQTIPCNGKVALAIHGMFHTAATWEPLVTALFDDNPTDRTMCRVVALDMPGRGGSVVHGIPWFGAVSLDDYVTGILGALDRLKQLNIRPDAVFGHSLGGLMVQLVTNRPEVAAGIFAADHGTGLTVVSYQQDLVLLPGEARTLYEYLTGDDTDVRWFSWSALNRCTTRTCRTRHSFSTRSPPCCGCRERRACSRNATEDAMIRRTCTSARRGGTSVAPSSSWPTGWSSRASIAREYRFSNRRSGERSIEALVNHLRHLASKKSSSYRNGAENQR